jgi:hypothetical protein
MYVCVYVYMEIGRDLPSGRGIVQSRAHMNCFVCVCVCMCVYIEIGRGLPSGRGIGLAMTHPQLSSTHTTQHKPRKHSSYIHTYIHTLFTHTYIHTCTHTCEAICMTVSGLR